MRQQEHKACLAHPLGFRALYVLVDYHLCRIVEVTKLSLPHAQVLGALKGVAIFVGHGADLVEVSVEDLEPSSI